MTFRKSYPDRASWLKGREAGLGASDAGIVLGISNYKSPIQLWKEKCGIAKSKEIEGNQRIDFGNAAEEPLRGMFRLMHPEYELTFEPFTILRQEGEYSFLFCTPDGELVEKATGIRGIYESKTATCLSKKDWMKWDHQIPRLYYAQICEQMFTGDFSFAVVWALLLNSVGDGTVRMYRFNRSDCEDDIQFVLQSTKKFWDYVQNRKMPPMTLSL